MIIRHAQGKSLLIAHADVRAGLSVTRSLAAAGYEVTPFVANPDSFACYSKHFGNRAVHVPHPGEQPTDFANTLVDYLNRHEFDGVVPITDASLAATHLIRSELPARTVLVAAGESAVNTLLDKEANIRLAQQLGIPHPLTVPITSEQDIAPAIAELGFPIVVKRSKQGVPLVASIANFTMEVVKNKAELRALLRRLWRFDLKPQVQQFVAGDMHVICCFMAKRKLIAAHEYISLRRSKHMGILREIVEPSPVCMQHAEQMLSAIGWEGVACVQFLVDERNAGVCYLETNGRFWASVQGSINAGWNFPLWAAEYFLHGIVPSPPPISIGSRTCYHTDDLAVLLDFLKGGPSPVLGREPTKRQAILDYLSAFGPATHSDVFQWGDPLPSLVDHAQRISKGVQSMRRKLMRKPRDAEEHV